MQVGHKTRFTGNFFLHMIRAIKYFHLYLELITFLNNGYDPYELQGSKLRREIRLFQHRIRN